MATTGRVLVVYTGGTLGMVETNQGWAPGADLDGWLRELVARELPGVAFELVSLEPLIDSSNARPQEWQRIVDAVESRADEFDAFVVLHGTDTLGFSAAAVHFALRGTGRTVVLTGAQRSLVLPDSDAPANVSGAIRAALHPRVSGVSIYFDRTLVAGHHATKISSEDDHAFDSVNLPPLATMTHNGRLVVRDINPTETMAGGEPAPGPRKPYRPVDLVVLTLHPGLQASRVRSLLTPAPEAVVLRAYGTGNAPDDDPELLDALQRANDAGTVLVVTTQCPHGGVHLGRYAVSQGLLTVGSVSGGDFTSDALVAWVTDLLSQGLSPAQVREAIKQQTHTH